MLSCEREPPMNLPNSLTVTRIFLVPLLVVVLLTKFEGRQILGVPNEIVGAAIFALASLTDWADGYLARRRKQITPLGQMIDPLADKLLILAALISLVQMDLAPAWMVAVILGREFAVTVLRSIAHARGMVIPASPLGKIKMASEVVAILLLILVGSGVGAVREPSRGHSIDHGLDPLPGAAGVVLISAMRFFVSSRYWLCSNSLTRRS